MSRAKVNTETIWLLNGIRFRAQRVKLARPFDGILAALCPVMHQGSDPLPKPGSNSDILFDCNYCAAPLVVDLAAAGLDLNCQHCGKRIRVPLAKAADATKETPQANELFADLQRRIKENESQRTEITGYIKQLNIQLHRWQLRLQKLNERRFDLDAETTRLSPVKAKGSCPG
jgi:hypothetical protein